MIRKGGTPAQHGDRFGPDGRGTSQPGRFVSPRDGGGGAAPATMDGNLAPLRAALRAAEPNGSVVALILVEVERLDGVRLGEALPDEIGLHLSANLNDAVSGRALVTRPSAERFLVICDGLRDESEATAVAERARVAAQQPVRSGDGFCRATVNVGVALTDAGPRADARQLHAEASLALQRARAGRSGVEVYAPALGRRIDERLRRTRELREALESGSLTALFQPIVDLRQQRIAGAQLLLRWSHPRLGLLSPQTFLPLAEAGGLSAELREAALAHAGRELVRWDGRGRVQLPSVTVSLTGQDASDRRLPNQLRGFLRRTGLDASRILLEFAAPTGDESAVAMTVLEEARSLGFGIGIAGVTNRPFAVDWLMRAPVTTLSVDVRALTDGKEASVAASVLDAAVALARRVDAQMVAKRLESVDEVGLAHGTGCDLLQGNLFLSPVSATDLEDAMLTQLDARTLMSHLGRVAEHTEGEVAPPPVVEVQPAEEEPGPDEMMSLSDAADILGVSASTLRRWADQDRIRTRRTAGGHRRFLVTDVARLRRETAGSSGVAVHSVALPALPLPQLSAVLEREGAVLADRVISRLYAGPDRGWFAEPDARWALTNWLSELTGALRQLGGEVRVQESARNLARYSRPRGATLLEQHRFMELLGEVVARRLQELGAPRQDVVATVRVFAALRRSILETASQ